MPIVNTERFPLTEGYEFAEQNGLTRQTREIREMEIEWDRSYTSSVRRGRLAKLFQDHKLLERFLSEVWPNGLTPRGQTELRRSVRISDEYDEFLRGRTELDGGKQECEGDALQFALEAHLRDFLERNLDRIEPGLKLYSHEGRSGVEFPVDDGRIDILAVDREGKYVVVELKLSRGRNRTLGQLLYYMGWVDKNLGKGPCRGVIVANEITPDLLMAVHRVPGVMLGKYRMTFAVERVK
jgi:hypothetical protein